MFFLINLNEFWDGRQSNRQCSLDQLCRFLQMSMGATSAALYLVDVLGSERALDVVSSAFLVILPCHKLEATKYEVLSTLISGKPNRLPRPGADLRSR